MARRTDSKSGSGKSLKKTIFIICAITTALAVVICAYILIRRKVDYDRLQQQKEVLSDMISATVAPEATEPPVALSTVEPEPTEEPEPVSVEYEMLIDYAMLYEQNNDMVGWLKIDDTVIDYPVVQTAEYSDYYLDHDFLGDTNSNGTLIMDDQATVGVGTAEYDYVDGVKPSTNLIIHGHTMKSGEMFGNLSRYESSEYGAEHNIIKFDSLYEHREYELIAVFYTQIYYPEDEVFKFYKFFQADTQEEFDYWYDNIKSMSLYDTGVTAEFGDEFITLSCCSYQVEDGRFVVVGKRIV